MADFCVTTFNLVLLGFQQYQTNWECNEKSQDRIFYIPALGTSLRHFYPARLHHSHGSIQLDPTNLTTHPSAWYPPRSSVFHEHPRSKNSHRFLITLYDKKNPQVYKVFIKLDCHSWYAHGPLKIWDNILCLYHTHLFVTVPSIERNLQCGHCHWNTVHDVRTGSDCIYRMKRAKLHAHRTYGKRNPFKAQCSLYICTTGLTIKILRSARRVFYVFLRI
jgi:hypothetical protein